MPMDLETFRQTRWCAVYGASLALQAQRRMEEGRGAPGPDDVKGYMEEAAALADMVDEVEVKELEG